ncbi:MAG: hypothetical protein IJ071_04370 [Ruminococcus sp.]|nr:hypothetical protein [Ruminococcus sp.]
MNCLSAVDHPKIAPVDMPSYFRVCRRLNVGGGVTVGTSYGINDKMKKIALLLQYCNEPHSVFSIDQA